MAESPESTRRVLDLLSLYFFNAEERWMSPVTGDGMLSTLHDLYPEAFAQLKAIASEYGQPAPPAPRSVTAGRDIGVAVTGDRNTVLTGDHAVHVAGDHVDFRDATFHQPVVGVQHVRHTYGSDSAIERLVPDDWPLAKDVEPLAHGVRPTRSVSGRPSLPPYAEREADGALEAVLTGAPAGKFVVVRGEAYAGKTRTALRAVAEVLPDARVFAPGRGEDLRMLPTVLRGRGEPCVLWLDDLDVHLGGGAHGLEPRLLAQLTGQGVVVVATLREEAYDEVRQSVDGRVLDLAHIVELPRAWSAGERERARLAGDVRLAEAALHSGPEGVAAYLAVGPMLWEDWQRAGRADRHPRGHALVRAAIDLARCGLRGPLPQELLVRVHEGYADLTGLERESLGDALAWAAEKRLGVLPLLCGDGTGRWQATPYLVEVALKGDGHPAADDAVWDAALETARADTSYDHETVVTTAREAFLGAAERGDGRGMLRLGLLTESLGEGDEAEEWFRRAARAGQPEAAARLGRMLVEREEEKEAAVFLETAAEAGDGKAATLLGKVLLGQARRWLRVGAEATDPEAKHLLGDLLVMDGDFSGAHALYTDLEDRGYAAMAASFGAYLLLMSDPQRAMVWLTRAAQSGDAHGAELLVELQAGARDEEAENLAIPSARYFLDYAHYGVLVEEQGRMDAARLHYEKAYEHGDAYGAYRLAALLEKQDKPDEAKTWYRKAADMGHLGAVKALAENPDTVKE